MGAFEKNFGEQLGAARLLMEAPGYRVHVLGIAINGTDGIVARSVSDHTSRRDAEGIIGALQHEIDRIRAILNGGAS